MYLYNNGTINGWINTNGNNLFVYNTGVINGGITIQSGGNVTQIMRSVDEVTNINVTVNNFYVEIDGINNLDFDDIRNINANTFYVQNSSIVIDDFNDWQNWNQNMNFDGPITLIINDVETVSDGISCNDYLNLNNLHKIELTQNGSNVVLNIVRETNYDRIADTNGGGDNGDNFAINHPLEEIRASHPNDKLLQALDSVNNMDEVNYIKDKSARFNHGILLRPIKLLNSFSVINNVNDKNDFGIGFTPFYTMSENIKNLGGRVYGGYNYDDVYFNFGFNFNKFNYQDNLNDFYGFTYGFDSNVKKYFDKLWVNSLFGFNLTKFKTNYISSNNTIKNNPLGISGYLGTDAGYDFDVYPNVVISPFMGFAYEYYKVADINDSDFYVRGGASAKYSFTVDGIKYDYSVMVSGESDKSLFSGITAGFWSVVDKAGVSVNAGMLKSDMGYAYQLSLNAKMLF